MNQENVLINMQNVPLKPPSIENGAHGTKKAST